VPVAAIEIFNLDICDEGGFFVDGFAFQLQAQTFSYCAVAAVATDEVVCVRDFTVRQSCVDAVIVLFELS
jgi:hypothetical protein